MRGARRFALAAVSLGLAGGAFLVLSAGSHPAQRAYLIQQKNRVAIPSHYEPLTFAEFLALPPLPAEYRAPEWDLVERHTQRPVSLEGYIAEVIAWPDGWNYGRHWWEGDLHVHLREARPGTCFPEGPRGNQIVTEVTPAFQGEATGWTQQNLLALCERGAKVRISGWLLHDYKHARHVGGWRATAWEIHPVTRVEVWDPVGRRWEDLR